MSFPDLENCFTDGETVSQAVEMAEVVIGTLLSFYEDEGDTMPAPSKADVINVLREVV
ncbi:type II toxin-antitoxin system HicB family antitoxin [Peribacillus sp. V2I11]|uniref:type II toxin-antitoxin system HicB family antitoxin n=1 Tax=Peribacillus sp. V2I11 TaxID=3042277 RepID=UPI002789200F|nr:type II toxin-antitoxin system HicB family antitoxin [Peribacillus sp. V2I11]MDQ0879000.1 putative RNase H-like HicB family nuclease [Peribacillus sp. V2I11]